MKLFLYISLILTLPISILGLAELETNHIQDGWQEILAIYLTRILILVLSIISLIYLYVNMRAGSADRLSFIFSCLIVGAQILVFIGKSIQLPFHIEIAKRIQTIEIAKGVEIIHGYLKIDGFLGRETVESINNYVRENDFKGIIINSQGGIIDDAIDISNLIKNYEIDVYVQDSCESACVIIATSGVRLYAYRNSQFGFHRAGLPSNNKQNQSYQFGSLLGTEEMTDTLRGNGIPQDILESMNRTDHDSMIYYSGLDLYQKGIVTNLLD